MKKKRSTTFRTQLIILMALLVLLQSLSLVMALSISRVFFMLDAEAFRMFNNTTSTRMQAFNNMVGNLVGNVATEADTLSQQLAALCGQYSIPAQQLYLADEAYNEAAFSGGEVLVRLLQNNSITGAFFMLDGSNSNKTADDAHSSVYIRNSAPDSITNDTRTYLLEVGPISVSQQYQIPTSVNWTLDMRFSGDDRESYTFYDKPLWAGNEIKGAEMERYGYWAAPGAILGDNQQVVCYTMPLLDDDGTPFGILGIEISLAHFTQHYLPNTDLPYQNSFYAIAAIYDDDLSLDWFIPSGPIAQVYLKQGEHMMLAPVAGVDLYETTLEGLGDMYCSAQDLTIYSQNSPFIEEAWSLVGFVPQAVLHETSLGVRTTLITSIVVTTLVAVAAIFLLVYISTRKISGLSKYVAGLSPYQDIHFERTGMREIDDLTSAVEMLNKSVINASNATSKILELTLLPIGGFEVSSEMPQVVLTEHIYSLLHLEPGVPVRKPQWQEIYARLTANPAEGYENIYQYEDKENGQSLWLRILENTTPTGTVGVVLDVTKDVEENRRLAHELDYDSLTHLYNRTAFKREAYAKITQEPDKLGVMIFSDLDNLKYINDTFGHDVGDRLIIRAGEMFREFGIYGGVVSRISGDEFAIYLHGFASKEEAREVIRGQFLHNESFSLLTPDGASQRIRFSSGIAWYPDDSDNVTDLLKLSDYAMYEAKHKEKGSAYEFSRESYSENAYLLENREAINRLLDEKLIRFAYQPIVCLKTGEVYAYEALMRPLLDNFKSPMEILTVAAAQSKLGQLERLVMFTALQDIDEHYRQLGGVKFFVNSIPSHILGPEDLLLLHRQYDHLFEHIVIEIIEAESDSPQQLDTKVQSIQKSGMMLALDDFGSGYSNETRILAIKPNIVKIDMALIQGIHQNADKRQLVANMVAFCHSKGVLVVGEGVEEKEDLAELIQLDMDFVQGYYTGRPDFEFRDTDPDIKREILELNTIKDPY